MSDKPAAAAPNGAVPVVTGDGKTVYLPAALADDPAATEGLRRATDDQLRAAQVDANKAATYQALQEKFSGSIGAELEGAIAPAVAGAARGLTFGGSDATLSQLGPGVRRRLLDYQEYAPVTSTVGEIGAIAGAALLGDEAGLGALPNAVGRLGARVGASTAERLGGGMLARGAGVLAGGAVEGGIYGGASAVSESHLKDTDLTGEALVGGVGHGAVGGMVASGLLHGAGSALGGLRGAFRPKAAAFDALASSEFGEAAPGVGKALAADAEKVATPGIAAEAGGPYRAPGTAFDTAGEAYVNARGGAKRHELGEIWKNREVAFNDGAERIEGHSRDFANAITEQQKAARITDMETFGDAKANHMDKLVNREGFDQQADRVMNWMFHAQEQVNLLATDTAVTKLGPAARKEFDGQMVRLGRALESKDSLELFKAADNAKRFLGRHAEFGRSAKGLNESAKAFDDLYQGENGLMHVLEDPSWGKAADAQKAVNAATHQNISLGERFRSGFTSQYGDVAGRPEFIGNSEKVSSFMGRLTKAATDNDAQGVRDMIATRREFLDATANSYDHGPAATKAIAAERAALDKMEKTFATATKETALINQVKRLQSEEQAQKIGGLLGLATDTLTKPVSTLHRLAQVEQHTQTMLAKVGMGTKKLIGGAAAAPTVAAAGADTAGKPKGFFSLLLDRAPAAGERTAIAGATSGRKAFEQRAEAMASIQANPAALSARVGAALGPFSSDAPKSTAAATATAMVGLKLLADKMPPARRDPFSLQPQFQPASRASDSEIAQHSRYVEALDNPTMVLDMARKGTLTPDHVTAVKTVYPKLYEQMQTQVMKELISSKSELPYSHRIQLGILLDIPTDKTLAPDFVRAIQATYTASEQAGMEPPPPQQLSQLDVAGSLMTGTQSAASEGLDR